MCVFKSEVLIVVFSCKLQFTSYDNETTHRPLPIKYDLINKMLVNALRE